MQQGKQGTIKLNNLNNPYNHTSLLQNQVESPRTISPYLCGDATLHHTDVEVRRSSFVHLHTAVGDHKHGPTRELHISGSQRLELYQLGLRDISK